MVTAGSLGETPVLVGYRGRQVAIGTLEAGDSSQSELLDQAVLKRLGGAKCQLA